MPDETESIESKPPNESAPAESPLAPPGNAGGTSGAAVESKPDGEAIHSTGESNQKPPGIIQSAKGFFSGMLGRAGGNKPPCNCKLPGSPGQHKATCPARHDRSGNRDRRFDVPVVPAGEPGESNPETVPGNVVPFPSAPAVPRKRSAFYRKALEIISRGGSRAVVATVEGKLEPFTEIIGADECESEAQSFAFPDEDLKDMTDAMSEWEERDNLPDVHPSAVLGVVGANYLLHTWIRFKALDRRLGLIAREMAESNRLQRQRQAPSEGVTVQDDEAQESRPVTGRPPGSGAATRPARGPSAKEKSLDRGEREPESE